uniref:Uncharacterized protein n=1 Tax=Cacopsylla melanoneura TaxID=428564 RepID=A0A8D8QCL6_9HEMI
MLVQLLCLVKTQTTTCLYLTSSRGTCFSILEREREKERYCKCCFCLSPMLVQLLCLVKTQTTTCLYLTSSRGTCFSILYLCVFCCDDPFDILCVFCFDEPFSRN